MRVHCYQASRRPSMTIDSPSHCLCSHGPGYRAPFQLTVCTNSVGVCVHQMNKYLPHAYILKHTKNIKRVTYKNVREIKGNRKKEVMILHKIRRPNSLKTVPSGVANCRNLPFGRRATRGLTGSSSMGGRCTESPPTFIRGKRRKNQKGVVYELKV